MRVHLAVPWEGHKPGDTADVEDDQARILVQDGFATYATEKKAASAAKEGSGS